MHTCVEVLELWVISRGTVVDPLSSASGIAPLVWFPLSHRSNSVSILYFCLLIHLVLEAL